MPTTQLVKIAVSLLATTALFVLPTHADQPSNTLDACPRLDRLPIITTGEIADGGHLEPGENRCYRLSTPEAGWLLIDAATSDTKAWLELEHCAPAKLPHDSKLSDATHALATPAQHLLRLGSAQELIACVGPQDPRQGTTATILRTAFVTELKNQEMEIEPDGNKNQEMEIEPDGNKNQEMEIEPDGSTLIVDTIDRLCRQFPTDDHADLDLCAAIAPQKTTIEGRIDTPTDRDVLAIDQRELGRLAIHLEGSPHLDAELVAAELVDEKGHRLARWSAGDAAPHVESLGEGLYFLRIEGAPQGYSLRIETVGGAR